MIASYRDLVVGQRAMDLVAVVYELSTRLPREETYGLRSQIQRAAVSIPSNIAEGHARESTKEYLRYLLMARGSLAELETQLLLCRNLRLLSDEDVEAAGRSGRVGQDASRSAAESDQESRKEKRLTNV